MLFIQNSHTYYCISYNCKTKKKLHLNILTSHGDTMGDTGLLGHTVQYCIIMELL